MANYKVSESAKEDLDRIWFYGLEKHGLEQANKYYFDFINQFERIVEQPFLYKKVDNIRQGYRSCVCGVDTIYYRIENKMVEIMNIIGHQDFRH